MAVSLTIDIILGLIILVTVIRNAIRGFIKSLIVMMKSALAIFLAYLFNAPLARGISAWLFEDMSRGWVNSIMLSTEHKSGGYALYQIFDGIPEWFVNVTMSNGIEQEKVNYYFVEKNLASSEIVEEFSYPLGSALSMLISRIIAFVVLFIVIEIILIFVGKLLNRLSDAPIWKGINILLGALMGAMISAAIVWFLSMCIIWVIDFGANYYPNVFTHEIVENTVILEFFGEYNLFTTVAGWFA